MRLHRLRTLPLLRTLPRLLVGAVTAAVCALALPAAGTARAAASWPTSYRLPGDSAYPESITRVPGTDTFFVSSYGTGDIYRGTFGNATPTVFISGDSTHTNAAGVKDDGKGHLFVVRPAADVVDVYDDAKGTLLSELSTASYGAGGLLNDVVVAPDGTAYVTDSHRPYLFRVRPYGRGYTLDKWLDLSGTAFAYTSATGVAGVNANGIALSPDGAHLVVAQTNTGGLYRISTATGQVTAVTVSGGALGHPDGLNYAGGVLYVAGNDADTVSEVTLNADWSAATVTAQRTDSAFLQPSAALPVDDRLLVTEFQHNTTTPTLPFTVTSLPL